MRCDLLRILGPFMRYEMRNGKHLLERGLFLYIGRCGPIMCALFGSVYFCLGVKSFMGSGLGVDREVLRFVPIVVFNIINTRLHIKS